MTTSLQLHTVKDGSAERRAMEIDSRIRLLESMQFMGNVRPAMPAEFPLALGSAYFRQEKLQEAKAEYEEATRLESQAGPRPQQPGRDLPADRAFRAEAETELSRAEKSGITQSTHTSRKTSRRPRRRAKP